MPLDPKEHPPFRVDLPLVHALIVTSRPVEAAGVVPGSVVEVGGRGHGSGGFAPVLVLEKEDEVRMRWMSIFPVCEAESNLSFLREKTSFLGC